MRLRLKIETFLFGKEKAKSRLLDRTCKRLLRLNKKIEKRYGVGMDQKYLDEYEMLKLQGGKK